MQNFEGIIVFTWTQTYREIFKSALVYLEDSGRKFSFITINNVNTCENNVAQSFELIFCDCER